MDHKQHEVIAKWERRWLSGSALMSLAFVIFIAISLALEGTHIAQTTNRTTPDKLTSHELFAQPGVTALGPRHYQVATVAQAFAFTPSEIILPIGAQVDFYLTARDVLHGYQIEDTNINVEAIPGEISYFQYTFDKAGDYRLTCNEYCGISHQNMMGNIKVVSAAEFSAAVQDKQNEALALAQEGNLGEAVYAANCQSCHQANGQGLTGAFPPLEGHAAQLYNADGGRDYLANLMLYGLQGSIKASGTSYNGVMPAWAQLSDEDLAETLNYILTSWGNDELISSFSDYTAQDINALRGQDLSANDIYQLRQSKGLE